MRHLDVEVYQGRIVSIWHGCLALPFEVHEVDSERADEMISMNESNFKAEDKGYHSIDHLDHRLEKEMREVAPKAESDPLSLREV